MGDGAAIGTSLGHARKLLLAGLRLAMSAGNGDIGPARRMVALLVDGLHYGARP